MLSRISIGRVTNSVFRLRVTISNVEPTLPDSVPDHKNQPYLMGIVSHALNLEAKSWDKGDAQISSVRAFAYSPTNLSNTTWMTSTWPNQEQFCRVSLRSVKSLCVGGSRRVVPQTGFSELTLRSQMSNRHYLNRIPTTTTHKTLELCYWRHQNLIQIGPETLQC